MSLSEMSLMKRLATGVAVAALAVTLAACSDEKKEETAKAPETSQTTTGESASSTPATSSGTTTTTTTETAQAPAAEAKSVEVPTADGDVDMAEVMKPGALPEMALGEANAPVTIVEYMSTTCPHCAAFHNNTFEAIKTKYVDSGKVRFVMREFPFDPRAAAAFMLARCKPQNPAELSDASQYFPMISMLMKQQETWAAAQDGREALLQMSKLAGFTQESFQACLTNQKLLDDVNAVRERGAKEFGIAATPTFLINGKRYSGDMSVDTMSALIDSML
ncbi:MULTISPECIES: DsbA family protein [unclassified Shinella]|jgi:protein-disulfide isomerase|uniref:DsbA family protein n=1 Tax=unclassified Shinella TaxID=2643062 RepID=UPI00234E3FCC|nr:MULTISPECIES: DsbA family protein [unclassified Shinella]MCO5150270.1 DsbA family protein [Shinella sp.]MDC7261217.1 DsbA family protein [Shinella sp. HY16]MDC7268112.1 DsbA family protein [Shinella sp. YZ44]